MVVIRVPGRWEGSEQGRVRNGITCVWNEYRSMLAGRPGLNSDQTASHTVPDSRLLSRSTALATPDVMTCHVTVVSLAWP